MEDDGRLPVVTPKFQPIRGCLRCGAPDPSRVLRKPKIPRWFYGSGGTTLRLPQIDTKKCDDDETEIDGFQKVQEWLRRSCMAPYTGKNNSQTKQSHPHMIKSIHRNHTKPKYRQRAFDNNLPISGLAEYDGGDWYSELRAKAFHGRSDMFTNSVTPNSEQKLRRDILAPNTPSTQPISLYDVKKYRLGGDVSRNTRHIQNAESSAVEQLEKQRARTYNLHSRLQDVLNM